MSIKPLLYLNLVVKYQPSAQIVVWPQRTLLLQAKQSKLEYLPSIPK
nr:MAG TPA: hypothetical protein [Caudoviricetes sp.]